MKPISQAYVHPHVIVDGRCRRAIHIRVDEARARICLFDDPKLIVDGSRLEVRPPLAFQVLVALALSKPRTVSRSEMARMLFPGVDPKERRAQLRIVLSHLRRRLEDGALLNVYSEVGTDLQLDEEVQIDAYELVSGEPISFDRLSAYVKPVLLGCQSRFAEKCRGTVKNAVEASLPSALSCCRASNDLWVIAPILGQLRTLYPLSATICGYRIAVLKRLDLFEEATREISDFETEWLESYGAQDKPNIDEIVDRIRLPIEETMP